MKLCPVSLLWLGVICSPNWRSLALPNGLGATPPRGWSSWNLLALAINDTVIREMADAMASSGLAAAGYK